MRLYSTYHIVFVVLALVILAALILVFKLALKTDKQRDIFIRVLGGVLALSLIWNRIAITIWRDQGLGIRALIPNSYCGMSNLLLGLFVAFGKRNMKAFHFLYYLALFGGIATVFYPTFLKQNPSFFFPPTLSGMNHHALGVMLCIIMPMGKWFEPSFKNWYVFPLGICAYTVFGLFLLDVLKIPESMNVDAPIIPGTPMTWWFVLLVGSAIEVGFTFAYDKIKAHLLKKKGVQAEAVEAVEAPTENTENIEPAQNVEEEKTDKF